ncbi:MAG TPA: LamG-like jellyroll fold domain-containing protein [Verrucomicrobiae bacterium]
MQFVLRLVVLSALSSGLVAHATVMPIRFYHMGEDDPGVGHTVVVTNSFDSAGTNALTITGAPKYWATAASGNTNSSYSMMFSVGDEATAGVVTNTDNVCLEAWADTGWRASHVVAYNGDSATNGYGFILSNTNYLAVLGGVGIAATIPCPPGSWMHLAMVCSNGVVAVYTNGTLAAVTNAVPNPPTGNLFIGGPNVGAVPNYDPTYPYDFVDGFVDDVRISSFAPGGFNPADLLDRPPVGTPLSIGLSGGNVMVGVPAGKTLARLQTTASLVSPNWQSADAPEVLATQQTRTDSIQGPAMFYRLNPSAGSPVPAILDDGILIVSQGVPTFTEWDGFPNYEAFPDLDGTSFNLLDASASVDLLSDSTNTLSCHWVVYQPAVLGGLCYTNLPDYNSLALPLAANSLPALQNTGDGSTFWRMEVFVRHIPYTPNVVPAQQSIFWFHVQYVSSQLDISTITFVPPSQNSEWDH